MTDQPFHANANADDLNTLLDALATGKRAPDAGSASNTDVYAAVHRLVAGDAAADASGTPSDHTLDEIWRTIMHTASPAAAIPEVTPPQSARQKARLSTVPDRPRVSRFQTLLSMSAVAAMLLVLIGTAWFGRGNNNGNSESGRYAAVPFDDGTPEATGWIATAPGASWMTPIDPAECSREPMPQDEYAEAMTTKPDLSARSYAVTGPADESTANQATHVARGYIACANNERSRAYESPTYLFYSSATIDNRDTIDDYYAQRAEGRAAFQEEYGDYQPEDFYIILPGDPPAAAEEYWAEQPEVPSVYLETVYNPAFVTELEDGRLAVPATWVAWEADPSFDAEQGSYPPEATVVYILVMEENDGEWRVDDMIDICIGQCVPPATSVASPAATPTNAAEVTATPIASYMHPQPAACTIEPLSVDEVMAIVTAESTPSGTLASGTPVPVPEMNAETYAELQALQREYLACLIHGGPFKTWALSSPDTVRQEVIDMLGPWTPEEAARRTLEGLESQMPNAERSDAFEWAPMGNPALPMMPDNYSPDVASIDENGRARVTIVLITQSGEPPEEGIGHPIGASNGTSEMVFVWDAEAGRWRVEELMSPVE